MALIRCRECGKKISEFCGTCPNCGYPIDSYFPNEAENNLAKAQPSNEAETAENQPSNQEESETTALPNEEADSDLIQPKQTPLSYVQKRNQRITRIVSIFILALIGIAFFAYPVVHKDDIGDTVRRDWYIEGIENNTYEATSEEWFREYLESAEGSKLWDEYVKAASSSTQLVDMDVISAENQLYEGFNNYIETKLSGKIFMAKLPFYTGGIVCFVISGYLVTTLKKYVLVKKEPTPDSRHMP